MTSATRTAEAEDASLAFQIALTQIAVSTIADSLKIWDEEAQPTGRVSPSWLKRAVKAVMLRRSRARELSRAYYRLVRALRTGFTIPHPEQPPRTSVKLQELRDDFALLVGKPASNTADGDTQILIEEIDGLREMEAQIERDALEEIQTNLQALGPKNLNQKLETVDTSKPATEVDAERKAAHEQAGARQAAAAARVAMDGGRDTIGAYSKRDKRVIGYIRLSRTGTPCGWCAMLISRGPVYKSQASATYKGAASYADGEKYHDNCHCYAEPVFSREQYSDSALYALNRRYQELWPEVTKGLSGKAALSAWRRFIRTEQQAAAREARQSRNVQEA